MLKEKYVVVIFSFSSPVNTAGNLALSHDGSMHDAGCKAVITQKDIANAKKYLYVEDFANNPGWHSTLLVASIAEKICNNLGCPKNAVVIAAPMHLWRATRDMKRLGFKIFDSLSPWAAVSWYEKESSLPWTRSWWRWWAREIPLRLLPWWLYKKLTLS